MTTSNSDSPEFSPLNFSTDFAPLPVYKPAGTTSLTFDDLLPTPLRLNEDLAGGCGGQLWPAGMVLATYILRYQRDALAGKKILELGAGGGLVGLAVALGCPVTPPLVITDIDAMHGLMQTNIALNNLTDVVVPAIYNWGEAPPAALQDHAHPDVVLAADCVYFEPAFPLLMKTLGDVIGEGTVCWFCFKKRRRADLHFIKDLRRAFEVVEVEDGDSAVYGRDNIFLYKITRKAGGAP